MTWSRFDDAARKHPKAVMAGNEAWGFWAAAIMYSNQYGTDGFVPDAALATEVLPVPIPKAKAKALADRCCAARVVPDGPGLFTRDDERGGYIIHDFLDWNPSKSEVDSKRKADRERKRVRTDSARNSARLPHGIPQEFPPESSGTHERIPRLARVPAPAGVGARAEPARPPSHSQPSPPEREPAPALDEFDGSPDETICPLDLHERAERVGVFRHLLEHMPGVVVEQLRATAREFVTYWSIGEGMGKRRRHWMRKLREHLRRAFTEGRLPAPGAAEHEARAGDDRTRRDRTFERDAMAAAYASAPEGTGSDG